MKKYFSQMIEQFESYLLALIHPYKTADSLQHNISIDGNIFKPRKLDLATSIAISWVFRLINGILRVAFIWIMLILFDQESNPLFKQLASSDLFSSTHQLSLMLFLLPLFIEVLFFPMLTYFLSSFWIWSIALQLYFTSKRDQREQLAESIVTHALPTHLFTVIPAIGDFFQGIAFMFYLYIGLRRQAMLNRFLAIFVVFSPILVILCLLMSFGLFVALQS